MSFNFFRPSTPLLLLALLTSGCDYFKGFINKGEINTTESADLATLNAKVEAFRITVYPKVTANCSGCHAPGAQAQRMPFGSSDILQAYEAAKLEVNDPNNIPQADLVTKTKDGHCGVRCSTDGSDMQQRVEQWYAVENEINTPAKARFLSTSLSLNENSSGIATVQLSKPNTLTTITVPYSISGTAQNPSDHNLVNGSVLFLPGEVSKNIPFSIAEDQDREPNELLILTLGSPQNAELDSPEFRICSVTILDNDPIPTVSISSPLLNLSEANPAGSFVLTLNRRTFENVSVNFTVAGTAQNPSDHNLVGRQLTIPAGSLTHTENFLLNNDTVSEPSETLSVQLTNPIAATLGTSLITYTIADNDLANVPTVQFSSAGASVPEAQANYSPTISLSASSLQTITVNYDLGPGTTGSLGNDFTLPSPRSITFLPGEVGPKPIMVGIINDTLDEPDERVEILLTSATNANLGTPSSVIGTISDNDNPSTVRFLTASQNLQENAGQATVGLSLDRASGFNITVPFTVNGTASTSDYNALALTPIVIPAGSTGLNLTFNITDDTLFEPGSSETVILSMTTASIQNALAGSTTQHTVFINDNEPIPQVSFGASTQQTLLESAGAGSVEVVLNSTVPVDVTVPYTVSGSAANGSDHNLVSGTATILSNTARRAISFTIVDDSIIETPEQIVITLGTPTPVGYVESGPSNQVFTFTIQDNDSPTTTGGGTVALFDQGTYKDYLQHMFEVNQMGYFYQFLNGTDADYAPGAAITGYRTVENVPLKGQVEELNQTSLGSIVKTDMSFCIASSKSAFFSGNSAYSGKFIRNWPGIGGKFNRSTFDDINDKRELIQRFAKAFWGRAATVPEENLVIQLVDLANSARYPNTNDRRENQYALACGVMKSSADGIVRY